jgi:hypothetical protein
LTVPLPEQASVEEPVKCSYVRYAEISTPTMQRPKATHAGADGRGGVRVLTGAPS